MNRVAEALSSSQDFVIFFIWFYIDNKARKMLVRDLDNEDAFISLVNSKIS